MLSKPYSLFLLIFWVLILWLMEFTGKKRVWISRLNIYKQIIEKVYF